MKLSLENVNSQDKRKYHESTTKDVRTSYNHYLSAPTVYYCKMVGLFYRFNFGKAQNILISIETLLFIKYSDLLQIYHFTSLKTVFAL